MPIIERREGKIDGRDRGSNYSPEFNDGPGERYLSHSALEYGDYSGGSSDVQAANMRALADSLGVKQTDNDYAAVDCFSLETGAYGYARLWVRVDVMPDGWDLFDYDQTAERWEEHVRETLKALDDYPLLDDEAHSELMDEWVSAAWESYGRDDCIKHIRDLGAPEFAEWLRGDPWEADETGLPLPTGGDYDPWQAEGGEGGIYFDLTHCAALVTLQWFPRFVELWESETAGAELWELTRQRDRHKDYGARYLERLGGWLKRVDLSDRSTFGILADMLEIEDKSPEWIPILRSVYPQTAEV